MDQEDKAFKKFPAGRPRWLSDYQDWPCRACGKQVDNVDPHICKENLT